MVLEKRLLLDKIGQAHTQMKTIIDTVQNAKRDMSAEELKQHQDLFNEIMSAQDQLKVLDQQEELDRILAGQATKNPANKDKKEITVMDGFRGILLHGRNYQGPGRELFAALQADSDTAGGYLKTPEQFVETLIKAQDNLLFIRQLATVMQLNGTDSLGAATLDADPADADWTSEILTGSEDTSMSFGKRSLKTNPLAKRLKVSETLLHNGRTPIEQLVAQRLAYKFAVPQEKAFMTGTGAAQPLGLFTASPQGISTGRDVSTGNTTTEVTMDGLIEVKYSLKSGYLKNAQWIFHRDAIKKISKLKDGEGQYLWQPSTQQGQPDLLLGHPLNMSEYAPNTFTTGLYVGIFGDFSYYWIAESLAFQMKMLHELYAETNQVGFIGRTEIDAMPVLEEAFSRVALA